MQKLIDLTEQIFDRLTVIKRVDDDKYGHPRWLCKCNCGNQKVVSGYNLKNGSTKSCGCLCKEKITRNRLSKTKIGRRWYSMNQRCNNKTNIGYKNYGGRGISVCERWSIKNPKGLENFYADVGDPPKGMSLDRVNNNGNYEPNNWRWANKKQQSNNRRNVLNKKMLLLRKYKHRLRGSLRGLTLKNNDKIGFSKYFPYNSRQLNDHLDNIRKNQSNSCPMCHKSYDEIKHEIDHIIPTSIAKTKRDLLKLFDLNNLSLLCYKCNRWAKRDKMEKK